MHEFDFEVLQLYIIITITRPNKILLLQSHTLQIFRELEGWF